MRVFLDLDESLVWVLQERALATSLSFDAVVNDALSYVVARPISESPMPVRVGVYVRAGYTDREIAGLLTLPLNRVGIMRRLLGLKPNRAATHRANPD